MNLMKSLAGVLALGSLVVAAPALAQASPLVGTWTTWAKGSQGTYEATMKVTESAGAYAITIDDKPTPGPDGAPGAPVPSVVTDVKVDGPKFTFTRTITFMGQQAAIAYAGEVSGNSLTASAKSEFDSAEVTGTRQ